MTWPSFAIVKQEVPASSRPYRILETYMTSEGPRTRVCSGAFTTEIEAITAKEKLEGALT